MTQLLAGMMLAAWTGAWAQPAATETVREAYPPPSGATRVPADAFGTWLQQRLIYPEERPIRTYRGDVVGHRGRVVDLPLVAGDLQQCADSAMRLRAEWLRSTDQPILFHATSGDPMPWSRYRDGEVPFEQGRGLAWRAGGSGSWSGYLTKVFTWAGTASLVHYDSIPAREPLPGRLLVEAGFPGHAVVIVDVARAGDQTWVLLGEGFMPAQDFHIEHGPHEGWWPWGDRIDLGHWTFQHTDLRAFRDHPAGG